ncbi:hypothetical protein U1Q18_010531, partial [Sarracenia purpurea var. burkii]
GNTQLALSNLEKLPQDKQEGPPMDLAYDKPPSKSSYNLGWGLPRRLVAPSRVAGPCRCMS